MSDDAKNSASVYEIEVHDVQRHRRAVEAAMQEQTANSQRDLEDVIARRATAEERDKERMRLLERETSALERIAAALERATRALPPKGGE